MDAIAANSTFAPSTIADVENLNNYEIRDPELAKSYLLQSFCLARCSPLCMPQLFHTLRCGLEIVGEGTPLPLLGFISDIAFIATGHQPTEQSLDDPSAADEPMPLAPLIAFAKRLDSSLTRRYEDYVLGKCYADLSFERGVDALQRYSGRDRDKALSFLTQRIAERSQSSGVLVSPAVIKKLLGMKSTQLAVELERLADQPFHPELLGHYEQLIQSVRNTGELLGSEDIFELERGTALNQFGQRIALRQVLQAADFLSQSLPKQRPRGAARDYGVATNILEEDLYPVGGFSSISNRGTIESLLRSELAYIEDDQRPDLFDIKYVRDELLYYARDENQFFRRRLCFQFVLDASLVQMRVKSTELQWQQIIYILGLIAVSMRSLTDWLSSDALRFEIVLASRTATSPLEDEAALVTTLFHDEIQAGTVELLSLTYPALLKRCETNARESLCHCTAISAAAKSKDSKSASAAGELERYLVSAAAVTRNFPLLTLLTVTGTHPTVTFDGVDQLADDEPDVWRAAMRKLLDAWL